MRLEAPRAVAVTAVVNALVVGVAPVLVVLMSMNSTDAPVRPAPNRCPLTAVQRP